ncbi:MAG: hypothetical protein AB4206_16105 [Xenococcaceae cyanobacterium]
MLKQIILNQKQSQSDSGFSLMEVLVAALITFFFVIGSMQALVLATAMRVKAQEKQRASQLIQEYIEQIQFEAEDLATNHRLCSADAYDTDSSTDSTASPPVVDSYAQSLAVNLPSIPSDKQLLNGAGKTYRLTPTVDTSNSTAKILKISLDVKEFDGSDTVGNAIAEDYIEVIPNAAFECP